MPGRTIGLLGQLRMDPPKVGGVWTPQLWATILSQRAVLPVQARRVQGRAWPLGVRHCRTSCRATTRVPRSSTAVPRRASNEGVCRMRWSSATACMRLPGPGIWVRWRVRSAGHGRTRGNAGVASATLSTVPSRVGALPCGRWDGISKDQVSRLCGEIDERVGASLTTQSRETGSASGWARPSDRLGGRNHRRQAHGGGHDRRPQRGRAFLGRALSWLTRARLSAASSRPELAPHLCRTTPRSLASSGARSPTRSGPGRRRWRS